MAKMNLGAVTAYADAVAAGFTGSREEFADLLANAAKNAKEVEDNLTESKYVLSESLKILDSTRSAIANEVSKAEDRIDEKANERLGDLEAVEAVRFDYQNLTLAQQEQARKNIGSASSENVDKLSEEIDTLNQGGLNLKEDFIGEQVNEWLDEHPEATTTVQDKSLELVKFTDDAKKHIVKDYVTPEMFGGGVNISDNHNAIKAALDYLAGIGGGTLLIPAGNYKTSAISMKGYKNIIITGVTPSIPWGKTSCLQFIGGGNVGIQLTEESGVGYENEIPSWSAKNIHIKHIRLNCSSKVNIGLNCNYMAYLYDVTVEYAAVNGIVIEPMAYPVVFDQVNVRYSGGDGVYIKAPYTTVYAMRDSEFSLNEGYGMVIEAGYNCNFTNVLWQNNKRGGLKINMTDPALYKKEVWLSNMSFVACYAEANGTLSADDVNYDGNHGIYVTSYNVKTGNNIGKIAGLTFIGCQFVASSTGDNGLITGITNPYNVFGESPTKSMIDLSKCGTLYGAPKSAYSNRLEPHTEENYVWEARVYDPTDGITAYVGDGYIGKRGRMRELHFSLPVNTITAGKTKIMQTVNPSVYYPVLQKGTLYGINVMTAQKPTSGSLTFEIWYQWHVYAYSGVFSTKIETEETIAITPDNSYASIKFPLLKYTVPGSVCIGIKVTASEDYVPANNTNDYVICELFVES